MGRSSRERQRPGMWAGIHAARIVSALAALVVVSFGCERALSKGKVLRGVSVADVSLSGLTRAEAVRALASLGDAVVAGSVAVVVSDRLFRFERADAGVTVDIDATVDAAMRAGRSGSILSQLGWWLRSFGRPTALGLVVHVDDAAVAKLVERWEREAVRNRPFDGAVAYRSGSVVPDYPRPGSIVDRSGAVGVIRRSLEHAADGAVVLPLIRREAASDRADVDEAVRRARALLAGPVTLSNEREGVRLELSRDDLGSMLATVLVRDPEPHLELEFGEDAVDRKLDTIRDEVQDPPQDARFEIDRSDRVTLVPSRPGTLVHASAVAAALLDAASRPGRSAPLPIERSAAPKFTTEDARRLGIKGLVSKFTTYHPCCRDRVKNIHRIADLVDGTIVAPGATYSVNEAIGPRTAAKGFVPAPSIANGSMVRTVGGGISQFATTLFNAVFHGGYHVVQRQPHSYYFPRYPEGHEATLSFPVPDLAFQNDSDAAILIRTSYGPTHVTVKLFGDNGGRRVQRIVSRRFDITKPPIEYEADPSLAADDEKVKYAGQSGWTVVVARIVTFADGERKEEKRKVVYKPRARVVAVHPCRIPAGYEGHTGEDCPVDEGPDAGTGLAWLPDAAARAEP